MNNKDKYGEVFTPPFLVQQMIDDLKSECCDLSLSQINTVFEPGAGKGVFFDMFINKNIFFSVKDNFEYTLNEINSEHLENLENITKKHSENSEIILHDCLDIINMEKYTNKLGNYDFVLGNLPFTCHTKKFVPALAIKHKDDKTVTQSKSLTLWTKITHFCFEHILKPGGYFYAIIPCIWLKPDRGKIYDLFTRDNSIIMLKIYDCKTANTIFNYNCQTPICYVLVQKTKTKQEKHFKLYDHVSQKYSDFSLSPGKCIPTWGVDYFIRHSKFMKERHIPSCYEHILKISTLNPKCLAGETVRFSKGGLEDVDVDDDNYKIITGSIFDKKTKRLTLNGFVSNVPCLYYGKPKLILPHKRLAKFYKDYDGSYSCFGRDMYVFLCDNKKQIDELYNFLSNNLIVNQMIQNGFTIRMNFIEKYVFQYIPWIFHRNFEQNDYLKLCCE